MIGNRLTLARRVLALRETSPDNPLASFADFALAIELHQERDAAHARIKALLQHGDQNLPLVARAYSRRFAKRPLTEPDEINLRRIFASENPEVLACVSWVFRWVAEQDKQLAVTLLADSNPALVATSGEVFMWLSDDKLVPIDSINDQQLERIVNLFEETERLDDHFVHDFLFRLIRRKPSLVVELAKRRVLRAIEKNDWSMSAIGGISGRRSSLDVLSHEDGATLMRQVFDWALLQGGEYGFTRRFAELVSSVFGLQHHSFSTILEAWLVKGNHEHFRVAACVLQEAPPSFVFEERAFVARILKLARALGTSVHREVNSSLYAAACSGLRSGIPGEPFPEDVRMKQQAEEVLASLSQADAACELYDEIKKHAEREIERARAEGRAMDEADVDAAEQ